MVVDPCGGFSEGPKENSLINKFDFNFMFWPFAITHFSDSSMHLSCIVPMLGLAFATHLGVHARVESQALRGSVSVR